MGLALRIGIDFDNTIIAYDEAFCAAAKRGGLIEESFIGRKQAIRDAIRLLADGELAWQRLQGEVYGKGITGATMMPGVDAFLRRSRSAGCTVAIVSHKTELGHFDPDRINLRKAAHEWMAQQRLFDDVHGVRPENVFFESTREEKLRRIAALSLTHFIDDLEEVLNDPGFPPNVKRILFTDGEFARTPPYVVCPTWRDIEHQVFDGAGH